MSQEKLVTLAHPKSPVSEAYRNLRTNLQFASVDRDLNCLLITSAGPREGKTTTCANLGIAMAQGGKRVLLIDADLRLPNLHRLFQCSNEVGLTNVLVGEVAIDEAIVNVTEGVEFLPSGPQPPNPSELLGTQRMRNLLAELSSRYDVVLVDTPPVVAVTDACVLAPVVNGVILVVASGQTKVEMLKEAKSRLEAVNAFVVGTVLNKLPWKNGSYQYHYYYYYNSVDGKKKDKRRRHSRHQDNA